MVNLFFFFFSYTYFFYLDSENTERLNSEPQDTLQVYLNHNNNKCHNYLFNNRLSIQKEVIYLMKH